MKGLAVLLPVLVALQVGVQPALAWTWPVDGPVLRPFVLGDDPYAGGQHRGIDLGGAAGAPVRAPASGSVSFAGTVPTGGKTVTIRTADGYAVTLLHLGDFTVGRGDPVAEGDAIGVVGADGRSAEAQPSVYLGIRVAADPNGYVDPLGLLPPPASPVEEPSPAPPATDPAPSAAQGGHRHASPPGPRPEPWRTRLPWHTTQAPPSGCSASRPRLEITRARAAAPRRPGVPSGRVVGHRLRRRLRLARRRAEPESATQWWRSGRRSEPSLGRPARAPCGQSRSAWPQRSPSLLSRTR